MLDSFGVGGFQHIVLRLAPATIILGIIWTVECLSSRPTKTKWRHGFRNLSLAAINGFTLFLTLGLLSIAVTDYSNRNHWGLLNTYSIETWLHICLSLLALDLFGYLWHRANHASSILWRFHRVHHSDHAMDVTTSGRFHVFELATAALIRLPIVALLGTSTLELLLYESTLVSCSMFHHSTIRLGKADALIRLLIVTPQMHSVHHSRARADSRSNYASVLSLWDRLFGTHRAAGPGALLGLDGFDDDSHQSLVGMLATPFVPSVEEPR